MELINYECPFYGLFSDRYCESKITNEFFESNYRDAGCISYRISPNIHNLIFNL